MKVKIYQVNSDRDENGVAFMSYGRLSRLQGSSEIDSAVYDKVYDGEVDCENLEDVFLKFNIDRPTDFQGHSLSVSDVVEVYGDDKLAGFYFCDSFGFKKVDFEPDLCAVSERMNKPDKDKISVLYIEPGSVPEKREVDRGLESMQKLVGGYIETFYPFDEEVAIICNEEGKLEGLPLNRAIYSDDGKLTEIIAGNFFICATPADSENFESLTDEQIERYGALFRYPERFYQPFPGHIEVEKDFSVDKDIDSVIKEASANSQADNSEILDIPDKGEER